MTNPMDLHPGDPVMVSLPEQGRRAAMVESVNDETVCVWIAEVPGWNVTVSPALIEKVETA